MAELLKLTGMQYHFFAEYLPAVSETIAASVISAYLYSIITQHNAHFRVHRTFP